MANKTAAAMKNQRQHILQCAYSEFTVRGIAHTGISHIAAAAGLSRSAVYHHFGSKAELICALCDYLEQRTDPGALFSAALRPEEPAPLDKLTDALEKFKAGSWQEHSETRLLHFLEGAMFSAEDNEKIKRACGQVLKAREDRLRQTLYQGVIKGQLPANIDLDFAAQLLSAVIFSGLGFERFMPAIDPILLQKDGVRRVMELLKHCTRPRP